SAIQQHDEDLSAGIAVQRARLQAEVRTETRLLDRQASTVRRVDDRTQLLSMAFQAQQTALAQLASARRATARLVSKLKDRLSAQQISAAGAAGGGGMPITYGQWAGRF